LKENYYDENKTRSISLMKKHGHFGAMRIALLHCNVPEKSL
jgi:hypothetical protein